MLALSIDNHAIDFQMIVAAGLRTCCMKVFMSTWGCNGEAGVVSLDSDGDTKAHGMTTAAVSPTKMRMSILEPSHGKSDPPPAGDHGNPQQDGYSRSEPQLQRQPRLVVPARQIPGADG